MTPLACSLRTASGERSFTVGDARFAAGARFAIWSLSKTLMAAAVLRSELPLDEPIARWLPTVPHATRITLRQLLRHTSGLRDYATDVYHAVVARGDEPWPIDEWLQRSRASELLFEPDAGWSYSNIGYYFVRRLLETVRGQSLDEILRAELFAPLGIGAFVATERTQLDGVLGVQAGYHPGWVMHGLVVATASETTKLFRAILDGEPEMRQTVSIGAEHADPSRTTDPRYGLGVMGHGTIVGHTGAGPGGSAACHHAGDVTACALATVENLDAERWAIAAVTSPT